MVKRTLAFVLCLGTLFPLSAAADLLVNFHGGIGVIPVSSGVAVTPDATTAEVVNRNIVRGVPPAGQLWVIRDLKAEVMDDGRIRVEGKGLLLGGGNNIGRAPAVSVFSTLICGTAPSFSRHSTDAVVGVPLQSNGDFRIDDTLTGDPLPPVCDNPVLLIRNRAGTQGWFAAGIEQ